ncbi:MAG: N-acyl-D-amino-acid deacylase family protein [Bradymonadia bacterium]
MTHDLIIRGGLIVDGTGAEPRPGDVAISGGRIVAVGEVEGDAREEIDAAGAIVTPGFIDIHTHYDGQATWDADMAPSCDHGVTTCVMGNCGVGFAPVRETDRERLIRLMEGVEDIPGSALAEGIKWSWESFPEYMQALDFPRTMDVCVQVPHDALRVYVMGDRAVAGQAATEEDIEAMARLAREALEAGAVGVSTGRTDNHRTADGDPTPASEATRRELVGLAKAFEGLDRGVLQAVSDFDMEVGPERFDAEFDVLEAMAEASGRPMSVSLLQRDMAPGQWEKILQRAEALDARGVPFRVQVAARGIGVMLGLEATFHPFMGFPSYKSICHLPLSEQVARMRDPNFKAQMLTESSEKVAGDGSSIPPMADMFLSKLEFLSTRVFRLGTTPDYEPALETSLYMDAQARGVSALEALYDALLEDEGKALLYFPLFNYAPFDLSDVHTMLQHPLALAGLSDGGAHVGTVCDASFPTFMLTHWTRDRTRGPQLPLPRVVQMMTAANADYLGLSDRGRIAVGQRADVNVIDMTELSLSRPEMVQDLPGGGRRLLQSAQGYRATVVAGQVVSRDGARTGVLPGRLVRLG